MTVLKAKGCNILMIFLLVLLGTNELIAQDVNKEEQLSNYNLPIAKPTCGPWLQAVGENEFTVVWTTNVVAAVWVEVAPDDGSHFYAQERPKFYHSHYGRRVTGTLHRVPVTGLQSGTKYRYRIFQQSVLQDEGNKRLVLGDSYGSDILKTQPFTVTTLNPDKKVIRVSMVNDIHSNDDNFRKLTNDVIENKTDFVVFNGDMLSQIESEEQLFDGFLSSASELFASEIPFYALRGNHEFRGILSHEFFNYFPTPNNDAWFSFRHGPAYFLFLDSGEDKPDSDVRFYGLSQSDPFREKEAKWLEELVQTEDFKQAPIKIVFIHMPPSEQGWHGSREVERLFMPILNQAGIDLMLAGHLHKHIYVAKNESNNNFPILINSNVWRTDLLINRDDVAVKLVDTSGKVMKEYLIRK